MKAWVVVLLGLMLVAVLVPVFVPQVWAPPILNQSSLSADRHPILAATPTPRPVQDRTDRSVVWPDILAFGLQFNTPWGEPENQLGFATRQFSFDSGNRMVLAGNQKPDSARLLLSLLGPRDLAGRREAYGETKLASNYELVSLILNTLPDKAAGETHPSAMPAKAILLSMKAYYTRNLEDEAIYRFATRDIGGFQFGDPVTSQRIKLFFFDRQDRHYTMTLSGRDLTQSEIDAVLASISTL